VFYVNRRGRVIRVGVGTPPDKSAALELPRYGAERLSGIRCATQLKPEPPNEAALTAMAIQR